MTGTGIDGGRRSIIVDPADIRHLVVLGHPGPSSFNHMVAKEYCAAVEACGQTAVLHDLYAMRFDPLLKSGERPDNPDFTPSRDVQIELEKVTASAVITLVYPIWFGMPPAIIKGYIDRVLGSGFPAKDLKNGVPNPILQGKRLVILSSSASTRPWLEERGQWIALRQAFDTYLTEIFSLEGCEHVHFDAIVSGLGGQYLGGNLQRVEEQARKTCSTVLSQRHARQRHTGT